MESKQQALSFGRYLQAKRLEKKMSLEQVAAQTRIGIDTLLLIEQEDHSRLPAEVFVKGFLRAYAKAVDADGDKAVRHYESRLDVVKKIAETEALTKKQTDRHWLRLLIAVAVFFCVIILSLYGMQLWGIPAHESALSSSGHSAGAKAHGTADSGQGTKSLAEPVAASGQELVLKVTVAENTWMKVIIDGKAATEYNLSPGDQLELKAAVGYNLLIGNGGGLKITLNDRPVAIPGKSGQVVNLHLP